MYIILNYHFVADYLEKRGPYRAAHFEHLSPYISEGKLLLGGATKDPAARGILIFQVDSLLEVDTFVKNDPYFINGITSSYYVAEWSVVAGSLYQNNTNE